MKHKFQITTSLLILSFIFTNCADSINKAKEKNDTIKSAKTILDKDSTQINDSISAGLVNTDIKPPILDKDTFLTYQVNPKKQNLKLYWKDDKNQAFSCFQNLQVWLEAKNQKLVFAMNAGMYMPDCTPLGLFIQNGKTLRPNNKKSSSYGNFYSKPNGIFYIDTNNVATICKTEDFVAVKNIKYATQSGPILLIDGEMHRICKPRSSSTCIRNGVGILPNNQIIFVLAVKDINFYDFASYFKQLGCKNALFLDGGISGAYLPEKNWTNGDGFFGPIIGVTTN